MKFNIYPLKAIEQFWLPGNFSYLKNPRPDYGIMLVISGAMRFVGKDSVVKAKSGDLIFLPKGSYYEAVFEENTKNYLLNFDGDFHEDYIKKPAVIAENTSYFLAEKFENFVREYYGVEKSELHINGLFYLLLDAVEKESKLKCSDGYDVVEKSKKLLSEENIPIPEVARKCSLSESGFRKIFKEKTGISPTDFRLDVKINRAKYLLEATGMTVAEISDTLGFYDAAYFCRVFQKFTGISPKKYSKNMRL